MAIFYLKTNEQTKKKLLKAKGVGLCLAFNSLAFLIHFNSGNANLILILDLANMYSHQGGT